MLQKYLGYKKKEEENINNYIRKKNVYWNFLHFLNWLKML